MKENLQEIINQLKAKRPDLDFQEISREELLSYLRDSVVNALVELLPVRVGQGLVEQSAKITVANSIANSLMRNLPLQQKLAMLKSHVGAVQPELAVGLVTQSEARVELNAMSDNEWQEFVNVQPTQQTSSTVRERNLSLALLQQRIDKQNAQLKAEQNSVRRARLKKLIKLNTEHLSAMTAHSGETNSQENEAAVSSTATSSTRTRFDLEKNKEGQTEKRLSFSKLHSVFSSERRYVKSARKLDAILAEIGDKKLQEDAINNVDDFGMTVLHYAARYSRELGLLLEVISPKNRVFAVTQLDKFGKTVLHHAAVESFYHPPDVSSIEKLLKLFDNVTAKTQVRRMDVNKMTVLHYAAANLNSLQAVLQIFSELERPDELLKKDLNGMNVLHHAVQNISHLPDSGSNSLTICCALNNLPVQLRLPALKKRDNQRMSVFHHIKEESSPEKMVEVISAIFNVLSREDCISAGMYLTDSNLMDLNTVNQLIKQRSSLGSSPTDLRQTPSQSSSSSATSSASLSSPVQSGSVRDEENDKAQSKRYNSDSPKLKK